MGKQLNAWFTFSVRFERVRWKGGSNFSFPRLLKTLPLQANFKHYSVCTWFRVNGWNGIVPSESPSQWDEFFSKRRRKWFALSMRSTASPDDLLFENGARLSFFRLHGWRRCTIFRSVKWRNKYLLLNFSSSVSCITSCKNREERAHSIQQDSELQWIESCWTYNGPPKKA